MFDRDEKAEGEKLERDKERDRETKTERCNKAAKSQRPGSNHGYWAKDLNPKHKLYQTKTIILTLSVTQLIASIWDPQ